MGLFTLKRIRVSFCFYARLAMPLHESGVSNIFTYLYAVAATARTILLPLSLHILRIYIYIHIGDSTFALCAVTVVKLSVCADLSVRMGWNTTTAAKNCMHILSHIHDERIWIMKRECEWYYCQSLHTMTTTQAPGTSHQPHGCIAYAQTQATGKYCLCAWLRTNLLFNIFEAQLHGVNYIEWIVAPLVIDSH